MAGFTDVVATETLNRQTGQLQSPALTSLFKGLFTTAPTSESGVTGAVEASGVGYARMQIAGAVTVNGTTANTSAVLNFASVPAWIQPGMSIANATSPGVIPAATTVLSKTATTVTMSANAAGAGVGATDSIVFSAFLPATNSSGSEPSTTPAQSTTGSIITFATTTTGANAVAFGVFDALTGGNLRFWDWLGNNKWQAFFCSSASPGVLSAGAHGFSNGDNVVVSAHNNGGALPATGGSWAGLLVVAGATTDTFTAGVNTTGTGGGLVRKVVPQGMTNVTVSIPAASLTCTI